MSNVTYAMLCLHGAVLSAIFIGPAEAEASPSPVRVPRVVAPVPPVPVVVTPPAPVMTPLMQAWFETL